MPPATEDPSLDHRLTELEIRYTHQEALIETLSDLIREQHTRIDALTRRIDRLEERAAAEAEPDDALF
ncbi:MAG: SlyX family protein [Myxococcales bacterium]|nr:SlyX family protein [Myxococcales bacterium]MCB9550548.1 SlyX family protein [Myxococcales bacterium]